MTNNQSKLLVFGVIAGLLLMLEPIHAMAFGTGNVTQPTNQLFDTPSSIDKMSKLFGMNSFVDEEGKIMKHTYSAQLHGNMTAYKMFNAQQQVLVCIDNTLLSHS